jgi:ATP-dependent Lon protease
MDKYLPEQEFELPLLVTRGLVVFPKSAQTLFIERPLSLGAFEDAISNCDSYALLTSQIDVEKDDIEDIDDIYKVGTLVRISDVNTLKSSTKVRVTGLERVMISSLSISAQNIKAKATIFQDVPGVQKEEEAIVKKLIDTISSADQNVLFKNVSRDFVSRFSRGMNALDLSYLMSNILDVPLEKKEELLAASTVNDRLIKIISSIEELTAEKDIDKKIQDAVRDSTEKNQREYFLREKMKAIQRELGEDDNDSEVSIEKELSSHPYPQEVKDKINYELKRYKNMPQGSLEGSLIKDYIDIVLSVPRYQATKDNDDIANAQKVLDEDHYGLKKVKERILEYLAVKKMNGNLKVPILCFFGPPGCGKTSLCKSIARALDRKFVKTSLGGISDEGEIRGHRRTYVGSRPGRIINSLRKVGVKNPVFLLDEIDKVGRDAFKGDPSSALLEVLDPEQNSQFYDNYLEINYDLSNVLFICTANDLENIPEPLLDRLELIEVPSYTLIDKMHIAKDFLIKIELKNNGLTDKDVDFSDEALAYIIERYTQESGVRELERKIASVLRKVVVGIVSNEIKGKVHIDVELVKKYLGIELFDPMNKEKGSQVGVVTGLAWTPFGGDILPIEVNYFPGKGRLLLTGKLGDVMKESCEISLDYIRANASKFGIDQKIFEKNDVHVHVPEGAVSKDGPSAGCAITTAMVSAFTKKPVSGDIAMTGEVTLRGNALPIGGLREKTLAALRSGIKTVIVPEENRKSVAELPKEVTDNLNIVYMKNVEEAIHYCLK